MEEREGRTANGLAKTKMRERGEESGREGIRAGVRNPRYE